ncbi:hypothetical protein D3OALGB2SA_789 [Olavius algarvensis associated proteobacterium Delta 3]|nr:hypothetical protein D3OALGB2SA_789 [Olavius algarvensis associated proteobacterium Delta 3]
MISCHARVLDNFIRSRGRNVKTPGMIRVVAWVIAVLLLSCPPVFCENGALTEGIQEYQRENFEEAIKILEKARQEAPESSTAAFFLGLAYKQVLDFTRAAIHLKDAVQMPPRIKEALVELIEVLVRINTKESLAEAARWIAVAKDQNIAPAKVAFLEGLVLQQEGDNDGAVTAFRRAMELDPSYTQSARIQIAMSHIRAQELKKAKTVLQAAITEDPTTDLAGFARRYVDLVEDRMFLTRPVRITLGIYPQYDDNVILNPLDTSIDPVFGITNEESYLTRVSGRIDYIPTFKDSPWLFNLSYSFLGSFYDKFHDTHDSLINSLSLFPGYNFGRVALNIPIHYSHVIVRQPSWDPYVESFSGPLLRVVAAQRHLLEAYGAYHMDDFKFDPLAPEEDRTSQGFRGYLSWIWTYTRNGFFNLRYDVFDFNANGDHWDRVGNRISVNLIHPITPKLRFLATGEGYYENFTNERVFAPSAGTKRSDSIYRYSLGLSWNFWNGMSLVPQYFFTKANSNINLYTYDRSIYSVGIEYRF